MSQDPLIIFAQNSCISDLDKAQTVIFDLIKHDPQLSEAWNKIIQSLIEAIKLKSEGIVYLFEREDSWLSKSHDFTNWYWIDSYLRIQNDFKQILSTHSHVPTIEETIIYLQEENIQHIITGNIPSKWIWGLSAYFEYGWEDSDGNDNGDEIDIDHIERSVLSESHISFLKKNGISVDIVNIIN